MQITDMQFIDSRQQRYAGRLKEDEAIAWLPEKMDALCGNQIKSLVAQTQPDLIFITGDMVYGSFDDKGTAFQYFCNLMESLNIPWAPVFGNHDNESVKGVEWQCNMLEACSNCLFKRGTVSGNGNYTVGIAIGTKLIRVLHMLDTNGCFSDDKDVITQQGIYDDQIELIEANSKLIQQAQAQKVPAFLAYHIPTIEFELGAKEKGYITNEKSSFNIGVDVEAKDGDFGCCNEEMHGIKTNEKFRYMLLHANVDGVFVGHCHTINTSILYKGIKWVYGLKTGQYDYHTIGQLGGTLITLKNSEFDVKHIPALTPLSLYHATAPMFKKFFVGD